MLTALSDTTCLSCQNSNLNYKIEFVKKNCKGSVHKKITGLLVNQDKKLPGKGGRASSELSRLFGCSSVESAGAGRHFSFFKILMGRC